MTEVLAIVPVAAVAFLATNMDNFTLLVGLLTRYRDNRLAVSAAYVTSMILICLVGFLIGEAAEQASLEYIGFLGFVPIIIGISWLLKMARGSSMPARGQPEKRGTLAAFSLTLMAQIGNGTDTLLTFGVLFADSSSTADYLILITTVVMATGYVTLASLGVGHPSIGRWMDQYAPRIVPYVMIAVGLYILADTATDVLD